MRGWIKKWVLISLILVLFIIILYLLVFIKKYVSHGPLYNLSCLKMLRAKISKVEQKNRISGFFKIFVSSQSVS